MSTYPQEIGSLKHLSFSEVRNIANGQISHLSVQDRNGLYSQLQRGVAILETHEQMCQYLWSFGRMHQAKLLEAFSQLPIELLKQSFEVVDWGCGQGLGTMNLFDFIYSKGLDLGVRKVTLIY